MHYARHLRHGSPHYTKFDGRSSTDEYKIWWSMKNRCNNSKVPHYYRYGGRGIGVCERWLNSFDNFLADMGRRPTPAHSIDRIDNMGNYEPTNCRWATLKQQAQNKRLFKTNTSGYKGVSRQGKKWRARKFVSDKRVSLGLYDTPEQAHNAIQQY